MGDADREVVVRVGAEVDPSVAAAAREVRDQIAEAAKPAGGAPGAGLPDTLREAADAAQDIRPPVGEFAALESILGPIASKLGTSTVSLLGWASAIGAAVPVMVELYGQYSEVQSKADALLKTNIDAFDPKRLSAFVAEMIDATDKLNNMSQVALSALFRDATGKAAGDAIVASMDKAAEAIERYKGSVNEQLDIQEMILEGREREAALAKVQLEHERAIAAARAEYDATIQKHPGDSYAQILAQQMKAEKEILADRRLSLELRQAEHALLLKEQRESDRKFAATEQYQRERDAEQKTADLQRKKYDDDRAAHRAYMEDARAEGEIRRAAARGDAEGVAVLREKSRLRAEIRRIDASDRADDEKQSARNQAEINSAEAIAEIRRSAADERKRASTEEAEAEGRIVRAARARIGLQMLAAAGDKAAIQDAEIRLHYEEMINNAIRQGAGEKSVKAMEAQRDADLATVQAKREASQREAHRAIVDQAEAEGGLDVTKVGADAYTDIHGNRVAKTGSLMDPYKGTKVAGVDQFGNEDTRNATLAGVGQGDPFDAFQPQEARDEYRRTQRAKNKTRVRETAKKEGISQSEARKRLRDRGELESEDMPSKPDQQAQNARSSGGKGLNDLYSVLVEIRNRLPPGFGP